MGSTIKNRTFSCLGSLFMTLGSIFIFGVALFIFASQVTQAAEREFERQKAARQRPAELEPERLLDDPQTVVEQSIPQPAPQIGPSELVQAPAPMPVASADNKSPSRLVIPMLNLDAPVVAAEQLIWQEETKRYSQWRVPNEYAAGWHGNSAPLGAPGNVVLNGHHNVHGQIFKDLINLPVGEQVILYDGDQPYIYEVTNTVLLREEGASWRERLANGQWIQPTADERLTLVTCWPYSGNSHRLVVVAHPVET